jgi:hypothetical protein
MNLQTRVMSAGEIVADQDFSGSGAETIAHLKQNGRITVLFCAFEGPLHSSPLRSRRGIGARHPNRDVLNKRFNFSIASRLSSIM